MAEMNRIKSFQTFSEVRAQETQAKLAEENATKRAELATKLASLLDEMDITSFDELEEETKKEFITKAFGNVSEETEEVSESCGKCGQAQCVCDSVEHPVTESVVTEAKKLDKKATFAIAQKIADIFTQEDADDKMYIKYTVNPDVEPMSFDLDAEPTNRTPKKIADNPNYFGEYAGGSLYIKDNGKEFVVYNAAMRNAEIERFTYDGELIESVVNEAVIVTGKRDAQRVMKAYQGFFNAYPALDTTLNHIGTVKELYRLAMEDANFSREGNATVNQMKGRLFPIEVKVADLNNTTLKVSTSKLQSLIQNHANAISGAAKWSGLAIVEGTALFLDSIKQTKYAEGLLAAFNKAFESVQVLEERILEGNAFGAARMKAIADGKDEFEFEGETYKVKAVDAEDKEAADDLANESEINSTEHDNPEGYPSPAGDSEDVEESPEQAEVEVMGEATINEGAREEQEAMEIYTEVAGPDGKYTEPELAKGDDKLFMDIVTAAGYKGSKAKKIADEFRKIATMESVLCEATVEMDAMDPDNKDFLKFLKKHKVSIINKEMDGPGGGTPVITMQGKRKDLEKVLADEEFGWADPDLAEYIEESVEVNENKYASKSKLGYNDQFLDRRKSLAKTISTELGLKKEFVGPWVGFDYIDMYVIGDGIGGTVLSGALDGSHNYDELKTAAAEYLKSKGVKIEESVEVNEAEVKSDEDFKEYAVSVLQKAFGEDYDEAKAMEVIDGLISKHGEDYGAMVGALQSSLGESVEVTEANADGTISDDEDERRAELLKRVKEQMEELLASAELDAKDIGGSFRSPGIMYDIRKELDKQVKKFK